MYVQLKGQVFEEKGSSDKLRIKVAQVERKYGRIQEKKIYHSVVPFAIPKKNLNAR